ncbi:META domain-containing protein [Nocardia spumae]|uniref:META domain-containing protein n=1 Tax=Nocardia spumae TaxID=2887190 RepID=UPI001D15351D|nr:META domain-containing protein [Nocardia spumae]
MVANFLRIFPVLALLAGGVACSGGTDAAPTNSGPESPAGRAYISTTVEGSHIPGDGPLRLTFADAGRLSANAGCNTLMGTADLADHTLRTGPLAGTRMACAGDRAGADDWATALLQANPSWKLDGETLTLATADRTVTLRETEDAH